MCNYKFELSHEIDDFMETTILYFLFYNSQGNE